MPVILRVLGAAHRERARPRRGRRADGLADDDRRVCRRTASPRGSGSRPRRPHGPCPRAARRPARPGATSRRRAAAPSRARAAPPAPSRPPGSSSPNITTPGLTNRRRSCRRAAPPASSSCARIASSVSSSPHARHGKRRIEPCTSTTSLLPARVCSRSMFCVTTARTWPARSSAASATCPAFGSAARRPPIRGPYQRQTRERVAAERVDRRDLERVDVRPDPARRAEVRDPALGRHAGAREHDRRAAVADQRRELRGGSHGAHPRRRGISRPDGRLRLRPPRSASASPRPTRRASRTTRRSSSGSRRRASRTSRRSPAATRRSGTRGIEALTTGRPRSSTSGPRAFDDVLTIGVRCAEIRGARFRYEYAGRARRRAASRTAGRRTRPSTRPRTARRGCPPGSSRTSLRAEASTRTPSAGGRRPARHPSSTSSAGGFAARRRRAASAAASSRGGRRSARRRSTSARSCRRAASRRAGRRGA